MENRMNIYKEYCEQRAISHEPARLAGVRIWWDVTSSPLSLFELVFFLSLVVEDLVLAILIGDKGEVVLLFDDARVDEVADKDCSATIRDCLLLGNCELSLYLIQSSHFRTNRILFL